MNVLNKDVNQNHLNYSIFAYPHIWSIRSYSQPWSCAHLFAALYKLEQFFMKLIVVYNTAFLDH